MESLPADSPIWVLLKNFRENQAALQVLHQTVDLLQANIHTVSSSAQLPTPKTPEVTRTPVSEFKPDRSATATPESGNSSLNPGSVSTQTDPSEALDIFWDKTMADPRLRMLWSKFDKGSADWLGVTEGVVMDFEHRSKWILQHMRLMSDSDRLPLLRKLPGGWGGFLRDVLGITCHMWATPWSSDCDTFFTMHDYYTPFGGTLFNPEQVLQHRGFFLRTDTCVTPTVSQIDFVKNIVYGCRPYRIAMLVDRKQSSPWVPFIDSFVRDKRGFLLAGIDAMNMRNFAPEMKSWDWHQGCWEFYLFEGGLSGDPGGSIDRNKLDCFMRNMFSRKPSKLHPFVHPLPVPTRMGAPPHHPSSPDRRHRSSVPADFDPYEVSRFWEKWDRIAERRDRLLKEYPIDWETVKETLIASNKLLHSSPDRQLQRIARLSKLPSDFDLDQPGRFIYAVYGRYPPYIGQTGCISSLRSVAERYREHLAKAKRLRNHYGAVRYRRPKGFSGFGRMPSLARLMAREGPGGFSVMAIEAVPSHIHGGLPERSWVNALGTTTNQRLPFGGLEQIKWDGLLFGEMPDMEGATAILHKILLTRGVDMEPDEGLALAVKTVGHCNPSTFEKFFRLVARNVQKKWGLRISRRMVLRIPSYDSRMIEFCMTVARRCLSTLPIPVALREWYKRVVTIVSHPTPSVTSALRGGAKTTVPDLLASELTRHGSNLAKKCVSRGAGDFFILLQGKQTSKVLKRCREAVTQKIDGVGCGCPVLQAEVPALANDVGHVLARTSAQFRSLLPPNLASFFAANARDRLWNTEESFDKNFSQLMSTLQSTTLPLPQTESTPQNLHVFPPQVFDSERVRQVMWRIESESRGSGVTLADADAVSQFLKQGGFFGGVWDKQLTKMFFACARLQDSKLLLDTLGGTRFQVWGWADSAATAHNAVVDITLSRARSTEVLANIVSAGLGCKEWLNAKSAETWLSKMADKPITLRVCAPSLLWLLKWKSKEFGPEPALKWRDIVSYARHIFKRYAKAVGRSLQLLVRELCHLQQGIGFQNLLGVRDQARAFQKFHTTVGTHSTVHLAEKDMTDMFWEIPKPQIISALQWAIAKSKRRGKTCFFSIAKNGLNFLDRLGRATTRDFSILTAEEVVAFVNFDIFECDLLVLGPLILRQGLKGIPIGGFLSAQLAEIWSIWREVANLYGEQKGTAESWVNDGLRTLGQTQSSTPPTPYPPSTPVLARGAVPAPEGAGIPSLNPVPPPSITLVGETDFTLAPEDAASMTFLQGMMRSPLISNVTPKSLNDFGFQGWWNPVHKLIGCLEFPCGKVVMFIQNSPWDGACGGRMDTILRFTDHKNKKIVRDFLTTVKILPPLIGECFALQSQMDSPPIAVSTDLSLVFLSRYRDNIYICFMNLEGPFLQWTKEAVSLLLDATYGIGLKWEPSSTNVCWGEGSITVPLDQKAFSLTRKGVAYGLSSESPEWDRWIDLSSPNARLVWRSHFPALLRKSLWYALTPRDICLNLRSILWGIGVKNYPRAWWLPPLKRFYNSNSLKRVLPLSQCLDWMREGRAHRSSISFRGDG